MTKRRSEQAGFVMIVILIVAVIAVASAALFVALNQKSDDMAQHAPGKKAANSSAGGVSENQRLSQNVQRKNDATAIAGAVAEFANNNRGQFPFKWNAGQFTGQMGTTPSKVQLGHYSEVFFVDASALGDTMPLMNDTVRVVVYAKCGDDGGAMAVKSGRSYVVQYGQALTSSGDTFEGACLEG